MGVLMVVIKWMFKVEDEKYEEDLIIMLKMYYFICFYGKVLVLL